METDLFTVHADNISSLLDIYVRLWKIPDDQFADCDKNSLLSEARTFIYSHLDTVHINDVILVVHQCNKHVSGITLGECEHYFTGGDNSPMTRAKLVSTVSGRTVASPRVFSGQFVRLDRCMFFCSLNGSLIGFSKQTDRHNFMEMMGGCEIVSTVQFSE